jgi:hypothetical protein
MLAVLHALGIFIVDVLRSRRRLEAESLLLRAALMPWRAWGMDMKRRDFINLMGAATWLPRGHVQQ